jgi:hypothetical protein
MADCTREERDDYWALLLRGLGGADRSELRNELEDLCGGDPYAVRQVGRQLRTALDRVNEQASSAEARAALSAAILRIRSHPAAVAPLFDRYAEMLEDDFPALRLALALSAEELPRVDAHTAPEATPTASLWSGMFAQHDGRWRFRSGLARAFFEHSFVQRPARIVACHQRNQLFREALTYLDAHRDREPNRMAVLQDVTLAWLREANTPSQAWQAVAMMLDIWFGKDARLFRYHPREQSAARVPNRYYHVVPGALESLTEPVLQTLLHDAHADAAADLHGKDLLQEPVLRRGADGLDRRIWLLARNGREYGAIVWSPAVYDVERDSPRGLDGWQRCFSACFREIARFEQDVLGGIDIAAIQRIVQQNRALEDADGVLRIVLTAITARFGLRFHRAALLQAAGNDRLIGRVAIGHHAERDAHADWERGGSGTLSDILRLSARQLSTQPAAERTPLDNTVVAFSVASWSTDPLLGPALRGDTPVRESYSRVFDPQTPSALAELLRFDPPQTYPARPDVSGAQHPVLIVPIRDVASGGLSAALIVDKPFDAAESISQEQLDQLPQFAAQIGLVLENEETQRRRRLFDAFAEIGTNRFSLQQTLEAIADKILEHIGERVAQLAITIWESSYGNDPQRPDRRQSTLRIARRRDGTDRLRDWHANYYNDASGGVGCIDHVLFNNPQHLYVPDLPLWHGEHGDTEPAYVFEGVGSVYSVSLNSEDSKIPRGALSFQSEYREAFSKADRELFDQIAQRATNVVEKARSYEGLSRARRITRQLNAAMGDLIKQTTNNALYSTILDRVEKIFKSDLRTLDDQRRIDSAVLLAMDGSDVAGRLEGKKTSSLAEQLAESCGLMRRAAMRGKLVFIEHASAELVARAEFGAKECDVHKAAGAEASVWARVGSGSDMLIVLAWKKARRMNHTERTALPLLTEIAARTNGVIEQERALLRKELESSLSVDDYAMIEVEYTHQWNKRIRTMRRNAQYARELLEETPGALSADERTKLFGYLARIETTGQEAIDRMGAVEYLRRTEPVDLRQWLEDYVTRWNTLYSADSGVRCGYQPNLPDGATLTTRPTILNWIMHELLINARDAEATLPHEERNLRIEAGYDKIKKGFEISIVNNKLLPRAEIEAIRNRTPIARDNKSGRGVWIAGGQVQTLLGGALSLPGLEDTLTKFTIFLPESAQP